jgi:hypothetical protein
VTQAFKIEWRDTGKEPKMPPNPKYPDGIDLDITAGQTPACTVTLPYPAKRIGHYRVECKICGFSVACTTAGRPDDPRSIKMPCRSMARA